MLHTGDKRENKEAIRPLNSIIICIISRSLSIVKARKTGECRVYIGKYFLPYRAMSEPDAPSPARPAAGRPNSTEPEPTCPGQPAASAATAGALTRPLPHARSQAAWLRPRLTPGGPEDVCRRPQLPAHRPAPVGQPPNRHQLDPCRRCQHPPAANIPPPPTPAARQGEPAVEVLELDEMYTFVAQKKSKPTS